MPKPSKIYKNDIKPRLYSYMNKIPAAKRLLSKDVDDLTSLFKKKKYDLVISKLVIVLEKLLTEDYLTDSKFSGLDLEDFNYLIIELKKLINLMKKEYCL